MKYLKYILPPIIVISILSIIFIIKKIYPFGTGNIAYYDMAQLFVPVYTHLYDAMHGSKPLFFDWYSGSALNMVGLVSFISMLSPLNFLLYFASRDHILEFMSIFLVVKMTLSSVTMSVYLNKYKKVHIFWQILFSVMYAFSGYTLQYYTNINWLDMVILFPLLIWSAERCINKKKMGWYIFLYTLCLIINIYISFMITLFLLFSSGIYLYFEISKEEKKQSIFYFGIATLFSFLLSAFITFPAALQLNSTIRTILGNSYYEVLSKLNTGNNFINNKFFMFFCLEIPIILVANLFFKLKEKKKIISLTLLLSVVCAPIFFEKVDLLWHGGSYVHFPLRFGFIISFTFLSLAGYFLNNYDLNLCQKYKTQNDKLLGMFALLILIALYIFLLLKLSVIFNTLGAYPLTNVLPLFSNMLVSFVLCIFIYLLILKFSSSVLIKTLLFSIVLITILLISFGMISPNIVLPETSDSFIGNVNLIKSDFNLKNDNLSRIKCADASLNANYPLILGVPSISNWTNMISTNLFNTMKHLGYSTNFTRQLDTGGTVFSDALLNYKQTLSKTYLDSNLYTELDRNNNFILYDNVFTLPFGLYVDNSFNIPSNTLIPFEYQNTLYVALTKKDGTLFDIVTNYSDKSFYDEKAIWEYTYDFNITDKKILYFYGSFLNYPCEIFVNGANVIVPDLENKNNNKYPADFNNAFLELGTFQNELISIVIKTRDKNLESTVSFGLLDYTKMSDIINNVSYASVEKADNYSLTLSALSNSKNNILFLPISYDKGWTCTINGQNSEISKTLNNTFMGIKLSPGNNIIKLTFMPYGMKAGIIISLVSLLLLCCIYIYTKKDLKNIVVPNILLNVVEKLFYSLVIGGAVIIYILPMIFEIVQLCLSLV